MLTKVIGSHREFEVVGAETKLRRRAAGFEAVTVDQQVKLLAGRMKLVHKLANRLRAQQVQLHAFNSNVRSFSLVVQEPTAEIN